MHVEDRPTSADPRTPARPGSARIALTVLVLINLFNYIDRQVLAAVEPDIRHTFEEQLRQEDAEATFQMGRMGLLNFAFLVSYMLLAPVFGLLADRVSRWHVVGFGVILWSVASGASGWDWGLGVTGSFWAMFLTRCFVGVGEAAYGPVAPAMIADLFPVERRGKMMAYFYVAIGLGGALGYVWGGLVARTLGWPWAFYTVVPPGILLGVCCFFLKDPPRGQYDAAEGVGKKASVRDALLVLKIPSYLFNTLGMTMMTFAIGGLAFWMPGYLRERNVEDLGPISPVMVFGGITAVTAVFSTLAGGALGDYFRSRIPGSYFIVSGIALILGLPMMVGFLIAPFPLAWVFVFFTVFCLFFNTGPTNTILANVTHPSVRASAFALNILIIHLLGDAISPSVIGWVADETGSLTWGFALVSVTMLIGGVLWLWGARHLERDTALAHVRR